MDEDWDKLQMDIWTRAASKSIITTHPDLYLDELETREILKFAKGKTLNVGQKGLPPPLLLHCLKQST